MREQRTITVTRMRTLFAILPLFTALATATASADTAVDGAASDSLLVADDTRGQPRWEWGVGIAGAWVRDYPGSRHADLYALPYPWFIWRSDRVELGREGGRGVLYRTPGFTLDFTLAANPPSDAGDNPERAGMPEIDAVLEPGLRARLRYILDERGHWRLDLRLPVRVAFGIADRFHTYRVGAHTEPGVSLDHRLNAEWSWALSTALGFAEKDYSNFYYGVDPAYATTWRPAFEADGGYAGWQVGTRLSYRRKNYQWGVYLRVENVAGTSFADSPLVSTPWGTTIGAHLSWRLGESKHRVSAHAP